VRHTDQRFSRAAPRGRARRRAHEPSPIPTATGL